MRPNDANCSYQCEQGRNKACTQYCHNENGFRNLKTEFAKSAVQAQTEQHPYKRNTDKNIKGVKKYEKFLVESLSC